MFGFLVSSPCHLSLFSLFVSFPFCISCFLFLFLCLISQLYLIRVSFHWLLSLFLPLFILIIILYYFISSSPFVPLPNFLSLLHLLVSFPSFLSFFPPMSPVLVSFPLFTASLASSPCHLLFLISTVCWLWKHSGVKGQLFLASLLISCHIPLWSHSSRWKYKYIIYLYNILNSIFIITDNIRAPSMHLVPTPLMVETCDCGLQHVSALGLN